MKSNELEKRLRNSGLRVTPQRSAVLKVLMENKNHPDTETIVKEVRAHHPSIAVGTIYHILDNFLKKGLVKKVDTEQNAVRYDAILEPHIHLFSDEDQKIRDYFDDDLIALITKHIDRKGVTNFEVDDIRIRLVGKFVNQKK